MHLWQDVIIIKAMFLILSLKSLIFRHNIHIMEQKVNHTKGTWWMKHLLSALLLNTEYRKPNLFITK